MRPAYALLTLSVLGLTQCGKGNFDTSQNLITAPAVPGFALYHAFGDSITYGVGVSTQSQTYASLIAAYNQVPVTNYARSGDESCDVPAQQIFPNNESPALNSNGLYSLLIGTNDVDVRGPGPAEATYNLCDQAAIAWLATPRETKLLATDSSVSVTGASHVESLSNFNALNTDAAGATIRFPFTRTATAPVYLWYRITDYSAGTFTCSLDNAAPVAFVTAPAVQVYTQNRTAASVALYRFPAVPAGAHQVVCSQTSSGSSGMGLLAIGGPPAAGTGKRPRLLVGLLPPQLNGLNSAAVAIYDQDIRNSVALFAGDGLDVRLFDTAEYMSGSSRDLSDNVHPNVLGHEEIAKAFQEGMQ